MSKSAVEYMRMGRIIKLKQIPKKSNDGFGLKTKLETNKSAREILKGTNSEWRTNHRIYSPGI